MDFFVHGLFTTEAGAASAVQSLIEAHFDPALISALMRVGSDVAEATPTFKTGVGRGVLLGTALGALGGALIASGGLLTAGPLAGSVAGGAAGYLAGIVGGLGHWKDEIEFPAQVAAGMILVGVDSDESNIERARAALAVARPERIHVSPKKEACDEVKTGVLSESGVLPRS